MVFLYKVHSLQIRTLGALPTIRAEGCCDVKRESEEAQWLLCRALPGQTDHRILYKEKQPNGQFTVQAVYAETTEPDPGHRPHKVKGKSRWRRWGLEKPEEQK